MKAVPINKITKKRPLPRRNSWTVTETKPAMPSVGYSALDSELHLALQTGEFEMHYQPKARLYDGKISGMEALIRWRHPQRGLVSPAEFIPRAEENGFILPLGEWIINEVCRQLDEWRNSGLALPRIAINLSAHQLSSPRLLAVLVSALHEFDLHPSLLELEITESALMADIEDSAYMLEQLAAIGFSISADDFGTGYSSLAYLRKFPINKIKIDRAFTQGLETNRFDREITTALIRLAHVLGLRVIAEGVETHEQLSFLKAHGCDEIQGYLFSRPLAADACATFFAAGSKLAGCAGHGREDKSFSSGAITHPHLSLIAACA